MKSDDRKWYKLDFPNPKFGYDYVMLKSEREDWGREYDYVVVWLDVDKVIKSTTRGKQKWPNLASWEDGKKEVFIDAWNPHKEDLERGLCFMPRITLYEPSGEEDETRDVMFGNGRHRTEFFSVNGAQKMPFETRRKNKDYLTEYYG